MQEIDRSWASPLPFDQSEGRAVSFGAVFHMRLGRKRSCRDQETNETSPSTAVLNNHFATILGYWITNNSFNAVSIKRPQASGSRL